jgi:hypothetical protein
VAWHLAVAVRATFPSKSYNKTTHKTQHQQAWLGLWEWSVDQRWLQAHASSSSSRRPQAFYSSGASAVEAGGPVPHRDE